MAPFSFKGNALEVLLEITPMRQSDSYLYTEDDILIWIFWDSY
jgi:hypothetical protein